ncbi:MAG: ABC transporter substrate-binding protein [Clostridia bacterium]
MKEVIKKYKAIIIVISAILAVTCICTIVDLNINKKEEEIHNKLVMVTEACFPPYEYTDINGEKAGVDIDVAKEIAKAMDMELVIKDISFDLILDEIQNEKADFAAAAISISEERAKSVDFSVEYATSKQVVIARKTNTSINAVEDLKDKIIGVQLGSVGEKIATEKYPGAEIVGEKKISKCVENLVKGDIDVMVVDHLPAEKFVQQNTSLKILDTPLCEDRYGIAVKKGNTELLQEINIVLAKLKRENKIAEFTLRHSDI